MSAKKSLDANQFANTVATPDAVHICEGMPPQESLKLLCSSEIKHLVQIDGMSFESEVVAANSMLANPSGFLSQPLEVIFGPETSTETGTGAGSGRQRFSRTADVGEKKSDVLSAFSEFLTALKGTKTIWDNAYLCADELFTNAVKNAWKKDVQLFTGPISFPGKVDFFAEADDTRLVIGCRDTYGSMNVKEVLARMLTCYDDGVARSIRHGIGGAGIGSFLIFESCSSYYAGIESGKRTVVCVAFPLGLSRRAASGITKNIHVIG